MATHFDPSVIPQVLFQLPEDVRSDLAGQIVREVWGDPYTGTNAAYEYMGRSLQSADFVLTVAENAPIAVPAAEGAGAAGAAGAAASGVFDKFGTFFSFWAGPIGATKSLADAIADGPQGPDGKLEYAAKITLAAVGTIAALGTKYVAAQAILTSAPATAVVAASGGGAAVGVVEALSTPIASGVTAGGWQTFASWVKVPGQIGAAVAAFTIGYRIGENLWDEFPGSYNCVIAVLPDPTNPSEASVRAGNPSALNPVEYPTATLFDYLAKGIPIPDSITRGIELGLKLRGREMPEYAEYPGWLRATIEERGRDVARECVSSMEQLLQNAEEFVTVDENGEVCELEVDGPGGSGATGTTGGSGGSGGTDGSDGDLTTPRADADQSSQQADTDPSTTGFDDADGEMSSQLDADDSQPADDSAGADDMASQLTDDDAFTSQLADDDALSSQLPDDDVSAAAPDDDLSSQLPDEGASASAPPDDLSSQLPDDDDLTSQLPDDDVAMDASASPPGSGDDLASQLPDDDAEQPQTSDIDDDAPASTPDDTADAAPPPPPPPPPPRPQPPPPPPPPRPKPPTAMR